jgi:hypothetical protein
MTNICRRICFIFEAATFFVCVTFSGELFAIASNQYCTNDVKRHHIDLYGGSLQSAPLDTGTEVTLSRQELRTGVITGNEHDHSMAIDFNFQYTIASFDNSISQMTNGHLHSWDFPVSWHSKGTDYTLDYYLAPVISVSSNVLKNPDLLDREAMQLWTGMIYNKHMDHESTWLLGFRSDHRFGTYRLYPVAGFCWRPNADWQLQLVLPDFSIRRSFSNGINIKLFASPDGNKWHVFNKETTRNSDFFYNAIVSGLTVEWLINSTVSLELNVVEHLRRRFSFVLDDGTLIETNARSSTGVAVGISVLF